MGALRGALAGRRPREVRISRQARPGSTPTSARSRQGKAANAAYCAFFTHYPLNHFALLHRTLSGHAATTNDGWGPENLDSVFAHESGHVFGAPDEYQRERLQLRGSHGFFRKPNINCEGCAPGGGVNCIMKRNSWAMCSVTPYHLGLQRAASARRPRSRRTSPERIELGMEELLIVSRPETPEYAKHRKKGEGGAGGVGQAPDGRGFARTAIRDAAALPGVATARSPAGAAEKLSDSEQVFLEAWRQRKECRGKEVEDRRGAELGHKGI